MRADTSIRRDDVADDDVRIAVFESSNKSAH